MTSTEFVSTWERWEAAESRIAELERERDGLASYVVDLGITDAPSAAALPEVQHAIAIARARKAVCEAAEAVSENDHHCTCAESEWCKYCSVFMALDKAVAKLREVENEKGEGRHEPT
jgi:hypothetical protein